MRSTRILIIIALVTACAVQISSEKSWGQAVAAQHSTTPASGQRGGPPGQPRRAPREKIDDELVRRYERMEAQLQAPVPKRTYRIERGEPAKSKLFRADPKLLENKFVASFAIRLDSARGAEPDREQTITTAYQLDSDLAAGHAVFRGEFTSYPADLRALSTWDQYRYLMPWTRDLGLQRTTIGEGFQQMLGRCNPDDRPDEQIAAFLTSPDANRDVQRGKQVVRRQSDGRSETRGWSFIIYAPTAEEAERRAAGMLQLIDGGLCRPMQRYLLTEGKQALTRALSQFEQVAKELATLNAEEEKLAKPSEINPEILSQLKAQKVMIGIELSGLNARVKACDEMLKDPKRLELSALQSITDMKVKAEIERVGIKEKLDQINALIGEGDSRQATQAEIARLRSQVHGTEQIALASERAACLLADVFDLYQPPPLAGEAITVSPVEWTE
jgi:hypothetical protein